MTDDAKRYIESLLRRRRARAAKREAETNAAYLAAIDLRDDDQVEICPVCGKPVDESC